MLNIFLESKTYIFIAFGLIALAIAMIIKIGDNPPGIILAFISGLFFVHAFTHNFKKTKSYLILLISSVAAFVIFVILHNFLDYFGEGNFLEVFGAIFFLLAFFICIPAIFVGLLGSIVKFLRK